MLIINCLVRFNHCIDDVKIGSAYDDFYRNMPEKPKLTVPSQDDFSASYNKRKMARVVESDISSDGKLHYFVYLKHDTEKESYQKVEVLIHHTDEHGNKVGEDEKLTLNFDQTNTHDKTNGNLIGTELILTNPEVLKVLGDAKIKELFGDIKLNGGAVAVTEDIFKKISNSNEVTIVHVSTPTVDSDTSSTHVIDSGQNNSNVITPEPEVKPIVEAVKNEAIDSEDEDGGSTEVFSTYPHQPEFDEDETEENITPHAQKEVERSAKATRGNKVELIQNVARDADTAPETVSARSTEVETESNTTRHAAEATLPKTGEEQSELATIFSMLVAALGVTGLVVTSRKRRVTVKRDRKDKKNGK